MASQREFGTNETTRLFFNFFNNQLALLENLYQYQFTELKHLDKTRLGTLYPLLFSIHHTGTSISLLSRHLHLKECYILARSFLESLITYTYILSCDEEEYSRYLAYTKQKAYRVLDRKLYRGRFNKPRFTTWGSWGMPWLRALEQKGQALTCLP